MTQDIFTSEYSHDAQIALLLEMRANDGVEDDYGLLNACIQCVSAVKAANLLRQESERTSRLRNGLLRKVVQDVQVGLLREHVELVEHLMLRLAAADARGRQGVGFCLSTLLPELPQDIRQRVQTVLLSSRFVGLRRRGYKAVAGDSTPRMDLLKQAWAEFNDSECAWLLVKLLSSQELLEIREELLSYLSEGWQISRLYLRLSETSPSIVEELQPLDGISYSYVLAKLGRSISNEEAKALIERYETDERFGLLVWSIGQMGLWDTLVWLKGRLSDVNQSRREEILARFHA